MKKDKIKEDWKKKWDRQIEITNFMNSLGGFIQAPIVKKPPKKNKSN